MDPTDALAAINTLQSQLKKLQDAEARWEDAAWTLSIYIETTACILELDLDDDTLLAKEQIKKEMETLKQELREEIDAERETEIKAHFNYLMRKLAVLKSLRHAIEWSNSRDRAGFDCPTSFSVPDLTELKKKVRASGTPEEELRRIQSNVLEMAAKFEEKAKLMDPEARRADEAAKMLGDEDWDPERASLVSLLS